MPPSEIKKDRKKENSLHINTLPKQKDRQQDPWISSPELIIHPVFEMRKKYDNSQKWWLWNKCFPINWIRQTNHPLVKV